LQSVRIIGGEWRSRRIYFPDIPGLRPTQDRIRETLFNWLAPHIINSKCLDLFAGSGALGFEALSRGSQFTCFVDNHPQVLAALRTNAEKLAINSQRFTILRGLAPNRIPLLSHMTFDIVFLDPPFQRNLLPATINWLNESQLLTSHAWIYIELEKNLELTLPPNWEIFRRQTTPSLVYMLARII
jgi:16S rRNA (guanine966-N2)-methyltransferase